jgi:streptomycin 6-kinase
LARLPIPASPDDLTPEWVTEALRETDVLRGGHVAEVEWERVGAEYGFTGLVGRAHLRYENASSESPRSLIAKLPMAETAEISGYRAVQERDSARMARYYERAAREVRFYRKAGAGFAPRMYYADSDDASRRVVLLLEDVSGGRQGDVLLGCSIDDAATVIQELAPFHARWWGDRAPRSDFPRSGGDPRARQEVYGQQVEPFLARYGDGLPSAMVAVISGLRSRLASVAEALYDGLETLIHGDLHLDNMIFGPRGHGRSVTVLDWQTVSVGPPASDLAFFVTDSLAVEDRRASETALLESYLTLLAAHGPRQYSVEELRADCGRALLVRLAGTIGWLTTITGDDLTARERALQNATMTNGRLVNALLDYDALALID